MALPPQPLEFNDFSGGITENYLQADPRRYEKADNFLIEPAKELLERDGLVLYDVDAYSIGNSRVTSYFCFINNTILMPNSGRDIYVKYDRDNVWTRIEGMDGNQALQGGSINSQVSSAEFQRQIYFTSDGDGQGILPSKIFRDEDNLWVARTAGLPRAFTDAQYDEASLLQRAIEVANAIRTSMISHMEDAMTLPGTAYNVLVTPFLLGATKLHTFNDKYSLSYLKAESFVATDPETPTPVPTPAPAATNEATLFTLVGAMNTAYTHHMRDSTRGSQQNSSGEAKTWGFGPAYHFYGAFFVTDTTVPSYVVGPGAELTNNATPDTLQEAALMIDDLYTKWTWHQRAVNTHSPTNNEDQFDQYLLSVGQIGDTTFGNVSPTITPDWGDVIAFANNMRDMYNKHVSNAYASVLFGFGQHKRRDVSNECTLSEATTLDEAYLLIYWLRALYTSHQLDANWTTGPGSPPVFARSITFTGAATASITAVNDGGVYTLPVGAWLEIPTFTAPRFNQYNSANQYVIAKVLASGAGTATLDRPVVASSAGLAAQSTPSRFHSSYNSSGGAFQNSTLNREPEDASLSNPGYTVGTSLDGWLDLGRELFLAYKSHATGTNSHKNITSYRFYLTGSPQNGLAGVPYPNFQIPDSARYGYAFFFTDTYTVERHGLEYLVQGNPVYSDVIDAAISYPVDYIPPNQTYLTEAVSGSVVIPPQTILTTRTNVISQIPVLTNSTITNYALPNIKVQIYRTTDGGTTYYKLGEVPNGTKTYIDNVNDTVANPGDTPLTPGRESIYTSGGVLGFDQPPISKYIHFLQGVTYYGGVTDTGQYFPNRIVQSVSLAPDAAPAQNFIDLDDELTGLSSTRKYLIAFCKGSLWRVEGGFNTLGQGALTEEKISDEMGCWNNRSIVQTEIGVFFAGTDGFYYTDGFQLIKVSLDLDKTYAALTRTASQRRSIYGAYNNLTRRIHWLLKKHETDTDNSVEYVFHLNFGVKPAGAFTTSSNGLNYRPSSLVFQDGIAHMGHTRGALLKSAWYAKHDVEIGDDGRPTDNNIYIPYHFRSAAVDMGSTFNRKWTTKVHVVGQNYGDVLAQPYVIRDLNQTRQGAKELSIINYQGNFVWGDPRFVWGDPEFKWEYDGKMDLWRRFPASTLRSDFLQFELKPAMACVYSSSNNYPEFCQVFVGINTVQITTPVPGGYPNIAWPKDVVGYFIRFPHDDYTDQWEIIELDSPNNFVFSDPEGTIPTGYNGFDWEIWGYKKEQRISINSFVLHFAYLGTENQAYPGAKSNAGAGNGGQNP